MIHLSYMEAVCIGALLASVAYFAGQFRLLFRNKAPASAP
jgi:hypothetical protein